MKGRLFFLLFFAGMLISRPARAEDGFSPRRKFGLGLTYLGGNIRYGFLKRWSAEIHYYYDKATSDNGDVNSLVGGLRAYRYFRAGQRLQAYVGAEGDYVQAKLKDGIYYGGSGSLSYSTDGMAVGGFGGVEYYFLSRLSLSLDAGPYFISLKEKQTSLKDSGIDFIVSTSLNFYIF